MRPHGSSLAISTLALFVGCTAPDAEEVDGPTAEPGTSGGVTDPGGTGPGETGETGPATESGGPDDPSGETGRPDVDPPGGSSSTGTPSDPPPGDPIACADPVEQGSSALAELAATMEAGQWAVLETGNLNYDLLYTDALGQGGSTAHTDWSDELSWDPCTQQALYIGAGHLRPYGFVRYDAASNAWSRTDEGLPDCMYVGGYDGCFSHGYDHAALDVEAKQLHYFAGTSLYTFDIPTQTWLPASGLPSELPMGFGTAVELVVTTGELVFVLGGQVGVYDLATGAGSEVASGLGLGGYHNSAVYSPHYERLFFGGGNGSNALFAMDADHAIEPRANVPSTLHVAYTALTFDPVSGEVLFLGDDATLHSYDPGTDVWTPAPTPPFDFDGGQHALATPIHDHGVVMFMRPQGAYDVHLYKHAE